jgi:hypothetical protein
MTNVARESWSQVNQLSKQSPALPAEFGNFELVADKLEGRDLIAMKMPWDANFKKEEDALTFELWRINEKPDHASSGVEYNALVGQNHWGIQYSATFWDQTEVF